jgi:hypothetical protein
MQIPRQPRANPVPAEETSTDIQSPDKQEDIEKPYQGINELLQLMTKTYSERMQETYLEAQKNYVQAVFSYLGAVQGEQEKLNQISALGYLKELWDAQTNPQAIMNAQSKYWSTFADQQTSSQKILTDSAMKYWQNVREIWEKLQREIEQQNDSIANTLKEALLGLNVRSSDIPVLGLLYQSLKTMSV